MFKNCVLLLLLGFVLHMVSAKECSCTPDYIATAAASDTNCTKLKDYIKCIETQNKTAPCTPPAANLPGMKVKTGCKATIKAPCTCQIAFWATDRSKDGEYCKGLGIYKTCLDPVTAENGCGNEPFADLKKNVANDLAACNVPSTTSSPKGGSSTTASNLKDGARAVEANGLTTIILLSILGMFFM